MADVEMIAVQLCFVVDAQPRLHDLMIAKDSSIGDALASFSKQFPQYETVFYAPSHGLAVFGKVRKLQDVLRAGDRIEICAPLIATPMDARRHRAKREHKGGKM